MRARIQAQGIWWRGGLKVAQSEVIGEVRLKRRILYMYTTGARQSLVELRPLEWMLTLTDQYAPECLAMTFPS